MAYKTIGQLGELTTASSISSAYSELEYSGVSYKANVGIGIIKSASTTTQGYIKYLDGTMECWYRSLSTFSVIIGTIAVPNVEYPCGDFINTPCVNWSHGVPDTAYGITIEGVQATVSTTSVLITSANIQNLAYVSFRAIGRWK